MGVPIAELGLDGSGTSESRLGEWSFALAPEIVAGDTIAGSPAPVLTVLNPPGAASLTIGTALVNNPNVFYEVSVVGGSPGTVYKTACRVTTTGGKVLICYGDIVLIGPR